MNTQELLNEYGGGNEQSTLPQVQNMAPLSALLQLNGDNNENNNNNNNNQASSSFLFTNSQHQQDYAEQAIFLHNQRDDEEEENAELNLFDVDAVREHQYDYENTQDEDDEVLENNNEDGAQNFKASTNRRRNGGGIIVDFGTNNSNQQEEINEVDENDNNNNDDDDANIITVEDDDENDEDDANEENAGDDDDDVVITGQKQGTSKRGRKEVPATNKNSNSTNNDVYTGPRMWTPAFHETVLKKLLQVAIAPSTTSTNNTNNANGKKANNNSNANKIFTFSRDALRAINCSVELILKDLANECVKVARRRSLKSISYDTVADVCARIDRFSFLTDVIPSPPLSMMSGNKVVSSKNTRNQQQQPL